MKSLPLRLRDLCVALVVGVGFFQIFLPFLTRSVPILQETAIVLEKYDIDPSRYYYTDVPQVAEGEAHLRSALVHPEEGITCSSLP